MHLNIGKIYIALVRFTRGGYDLEETQKTRVLIELFFGIFVIFFAINQYFNQVILISLLEFGGYDTGLFFLNYLLMLLIGFALIFLAAYESRETKLTIPISIGLIFCGIEVILLGLYLV